MGVGILVCMNVLNVVRILYLAFVGFLSTSLFEGAAFGIGTFLIPSILMGLGVAIDVVITTLARFQDERMTWRNWTLPITITHIFFPAFGYFLFWSLDDAFPLLHGLLGTIGFILVALYVYEVLSESIGNKPWFGISAWIGNKLQLSAARAGIFMAVVAVSWDALWSGPARAAQAAAGGWNGIEVFVSFIITGAVVALLAEAALTIAHRMRTRQFQNTELLTRASISGMYLELSVIGGFGILSLWHVFSATANLYAAIILALVGLLFFFVPNYQRLSGH